jgi:DNA mismatch repair protein MutS2
VAAVDLTKRTLEALDWPFLLEGLASHARTERGARAARALEPLADRERILEILDAVGEACDATTNGAGGIPVGGIEDVEPHVRRAARGEVLESPELRSAAVAVTALDRLRRRLDDVRDQAPVLARWAADIEIDRRMLSTLDAAFDERGEFSEKTYPKLGELRRRIASLERRVRAMLEELLAGTELANALQDRYVTMRGDRFVVPIKAEHRRPDLGIVHDTSRTGHTVFVEPQQVVPLNNDRRLAESDLAAEERRIRAELSSLIGRHASPIRAALDAATEIDLACARADFARRIDAVRPEVGEDGVIVLRSARHPVLVLNRVDVVANDMAVTRERPVLVLTGPNAGGKTVALKTLGLCALLVRAGCFVPASPGSRVDVCGAVLADIGDQQTVHEGLSSFSGHLATLRAMLDRAGPGCLLLLDELASGTDPAQGGALARALIERFADLGTRVVTTTHYAQVKAMGEGDDRVEVAAMEYRDGQPTYRVVPGMAGESHALATALRVGIDRSVVDRAHTLMDEGERALHDTLQALEAERERSAQLARRADEAARTLREREATLAVREERIKRNVREIEQQAARALVEQARAAEREIARIVAELQRGPSPQRAAEAREAVLALREVAQSHGRSSDPPTHYGPTIGERVRVLGLDLTGEVVSVGERELEVRAGLLTMRVRLDEVEALGATSPEPGRSPARRAPAREPAVSLPERLAAAVRSDANTLDLRGERVEDALARLTVFLDTSMLRSLETVFVLHGHGTGALKAAIRDELKRSPYVAASAAAEHAQGGDALTVVLLRG